MRRVIIGFLLIVVLFTITGCTNKQEGVIDSKESNEMLEALLTDGFVKELDSETFDLACYDDIKYDYKNELFIHNDGTIWMVNYNKLFSNTNKHTIKLNSIFDKEINIIEEKDDKFYFFNKDGVYCLDVENDSIKEEKDIRVIDSINFRSSEIVTALNRIEFDRVFNHASGIRYLIKDNALYNFDYCSIAEYSDYNLFNDEKNKINLNIKLEDDEEIINYYKGQMLENNICKTNKAYYVEKISNYEDVQKYADVEPEYSFIKLNINKYCDKIKYLSADYIVIDENIYQYIPEELRELPEYK